MEESGIEVSKGSTIDFLIFDANAYLHESCIH